MEGEQMPMDSGNEECRDRERVMETYRDIKDERLTRKEDTSHRFSRPLKDCLPPSAPAPTASNEDVPTDHDADKRKAWLFRNM